MSTPTAAVLIVGNEVLSAKVKDENGPYAAQRLRDLGVALTALLTLPDRLDILEEAIRRERARVDWLFTSGGVGPTHDDVTVAAIARALGRPIVRDPRLAANVTRWYARHGGEAPEAALRMADVPEGTRLLGDPGFPVMAIENVVMLPGPPRFFRMHFDAFVAELTATPFRIANVYVSIAEHSFAVSLDAIARAHPDVDIGSYPKFDDADHQVQVTFEGKDAARVETAMRAFLGALPAGAVLRFDGP